MATIHPDSITIYHTPKKVGYLGKVVPRTHQHLYYRSTEKSKSFRGAPLCPAKGNKVHKLWVGCALRPCSGRHVGMDRGRVGYSGKGVTNCQTRKWFCLYFGQNSMDRFQIKTRSCIILFIFDLPELLLQMNVIVMIFIRFVSCVVIRHMWTPSIALIALVTEWRVVIGLLG